MTQRVRIVIFFFISFSLARSTYHSTLDPRPFSIRAERNITSHFQLGQKAYLTMTYCVKSNVGAADDQGRSTRRSRFSEGTTTGLPIVASQNPIRYPCRQGEEFNGRGCRYRFVDCPHAKHARRQGADFCYGVTGRRIVEWYKLGYSPEEIAHATQR
jgi:hypothetical protein